MIRYADKWIDPNTVDSEEEYWRKSFKKRLAIKNPKFLALTEKEIDALQDKLERQGSSLKEVCLDDESSIDMERLYHDVLMDAQFRRLVRKALINSFVVDDREQEEFLLWAIGDDYKTLEYQLWPSRMQTRISLMVNEFSSVYRAMMEAIKLFKGRIIRVCGGSRG